MYVTALDVKAGRATIVTVAISISVTPTRRFVITVIGGRCADRQILALRPCILSAPSSNALEPTDIDSLAKSILANISIFEQLCLALTGQYQITNGASHFQCISVIRGLSGDNQVEFKEKIVVLLSGSSVVGG